MDMSLQIPAVKIEKRLPEEWDFEDSVLKTRTAVMNWQSISAEILYELWVAREKLSQVGRPMTEARTWAAYCKAVGLAKSTVNRWLERFDVETKEIKPPEDVPEPDDFEYPEEDDEFEAEDEEWDGDYMKILEPLIKNLRSGYKKLSSTRTHVTPVAFSYFIGNIEEMAQRLETWKPKNMHDCPICHGKGFVKAPNSQGKEQQVECNNCIKGKVGAYRESEY
jgi:hypothetical protein